MIIGETLKEKRTENQLTQDQLAEKIFVSRKTISNWETGKTTPDIDSLVRLANLFELSLDNLLLEGSEVVENISNESKYKKLYKRLFILIMVLVILFVSYFFFWWNYKNNQWEKIMLGNHFLEDRYDVKAYEDIYQITLKKPSFPSLASITDDVNVRLINDYNSSSTISLNEDQSKIVTTTLGDGKLSFVVLNDQLEIETNSNKHFSTEEIKLAEKELETISDKQANLVNFTIKKWNQLNPKDKIMTKIKN